MSISLGFLNKEIEKADIHVTDTGENPEAPQPREMIDLEVGNKNIFLITWLINSLVKVLFKCELASYKRGKERQDPFC